MSSNQQQRASRISQRAAAMAFAFCLLTTATLARAGNTEIFVRDCGDDAASGLLRSCSGGSDRPKLTIQAAIDAASDGDVIRVYPGVWSGSGNVDLDFQGKKIVVRSDTLDPTDTIIDCSGGTARAVLFDNGETSDSVLRGFTVRNGSEYIGAAIQCTAGTSPRIRDCIFESNTTPTGSHGGAIAAVGGSPTVEDCIFEGNSAAGNLGGGAASLIQGAQIRFEDCTFDGNSAGNGGTAFLLGGSEATFVRCEIVSDSADDHGGSIYSDGGSTVELVDTEVTECTAGGDGGAIYNSNSTVSITRCMIKDNSAEPSGGRGGAIANTNGDVSIDESSLHRNESGGGGGAVATSGGTVDATDSFVQSNKSLNGRGGGFRYNSDAGGTLTDVTFGSNTSNNGGAGVFIETGSLELVNCSFTSNVTSAGQGGGLRCRSHANVTVIDGGFWLNESPVDGGAIACSNGAVLDLSGSILNSNTALGGGGAIAVTEGGTLSISGARLLFNDAASGGGAILCSESTLSAIDSSFENNSAASQRGGGVYAVDADGTVVVSDCTFESNHSMGVGPAGAGGGLGVEGSALLVERCDFIENTATSSGGGMFGASSDVECVASTFVGNGATVTGGGIHMIGGLSLTIARCTVEGNLTDGRGAGIGVELGPLDLRRTTFADNIASMGGGLSTSFSDASIRDCEFRSNEGPSAGGGSYHNGGPGEQVTYDRSRFIGNISAIGPGGGSASEVDATYHNCTFVGNLAETGGGIDSWSVLSPVVEIENCAFSGNFATYVGGATRIVHGGIARVVNCSFNHNVAFDVGGAVCSGVPSQTIVNCIFFGNEDALHGVAFEAQIFLASGSVSFEHSCFGPSSCPPPSDLHPLGTNICANPLFVDHDGPDNVVGTEDDDLSLVALASSFGRVSPCTNRGDDSAVTTLLDLAGNPRFNGRVDMGAYEQWPIPPSSP